ncbi:MAG TPA: DUF4153 domain-containing protein [Ferruginibacter sp.]|nr:DUF4153 domain-containing protein [Ferruginibacter sp.]
MKLLSAQSFINKSSKTFERFPFAIVAAIIGAFYSIRIVHNNFDDSFSEKHYYYNIVMSAYLAMLLFTAIVISTERAVVTKLVTYGLYFVGLLLVVGYYFSLPDHFMAVSIIKFSLFSIGLHLLIAFVPYITKDEQHGFWQYNKTIFLRILTSVLYTSVLYAGLVIALLAIDSLFKIDIDGKVYADLWILLVGIFNTWFFLAGFPTDYEELEAKDDYPKGLKIFTQFVLLPLITVYLVILYAYMIKIIAMWQWPMGYVSYLVIAFSIAGILSLLLIYPIRNDEKNKWILTFSKFFYFAIFPLIILLSLAIKRRISDYGITENRYFILVLAVWLLAIASYFLISRKKNIKVIPITLCCIAFLSSFGPWSAFNISVFSQKRHLVKLLEKNNMIKDGKIKLQHDTLPFADHKEICSTIDYLVNTHGYATMQPFFTVNLDSLMKSNSKIDYSYSYDQVNTVFSLMHLSYIYDYETPDTMGVVTGADAIDNTISYRSSSDDVHMMDISGYDYMVSDYKLYSTGSADTSNNNSSFLLGKQAFNVFFDPKKQLLYVTTIKDSLPIDVLPFYTSLKDKKLNVDNELPTADMILVSANNKIAVKILFSNIEGTKENSRFIITNMDMAILVKLK